MRENYSLINKIVQHTKTELHTHLMGMLSADGFIDFLLQECENVKKKTGKDLDFAWLLCKDEEFEQVCYECIENKNKNKKSVIDTYNSLFGRHKLLSIKDITTNDYLLAMFKKRITIPYGKTVPYFHLERYYTMRRSLLSYIAESCPEYDAACAWKTKGEIFSKYINASLRELEDNGVEYVEISDSIRQCIVNFNKDEDLKIKCKFLLSTSRTNEASKFKSTAEDLIKVIEKSDVAVGFDIMGLETPFSKDILSENSYKSFKNKLEIVFKTANKANILSKMTIRIHSGESKGTKTNTECILEMIDEIVKENNYEKLPEIRIGHAVHFKRTENYIKLLKKFNCIIEINATSNVALRNIKDYNSIPYKYYIEKGIPVVLATDGHGMYNTNVKKENYIARKHVCNKDFEEILAVDDLILGGKTEG